MEFLDEDTRPRFLFQSRPQRSSLPQENPPQKSSKDFLFISLSVPLSSLLISLALFYFQAEPLRSILFWFSISLLLGPFAPSSLTGGDIRVGQGPIIPDPIDRDPQSELETKKAPNNRRSKADRKDELRGSQLAAVESANGLSSLEKKAPEVPSLERKKENVVSGDVEVVLNAGEKDWSEEDLEILKKQMVKHPVGKPGRWEAIAGAFNGRHRVDSVIRKAKELAERKVDDGDAYAQFLKNRKPLDARINEEVMDNGESKKENGATNGGLGWSAGEDIALLNALKALPKDVPMRWEKIAAYVPGKSKAACVKRVSELKREFRSSKASNDC